MSSYDTMCPLCFKEKSTDRPDEFRRCSYCGFEEEERKTNTFLPYRTLLNNQYLVGKELGAGGFGITYLALDAALLCPVAIKEFFPRDLVSREAGSSTLVPNTGEAGEYYAYGLERFLYEARIMARFNHPNIVRVRNFFSANNTGYIVMDYYQGLQLEQHMEKRGGRLEEKEALDIILPILDGLERIHQRDFLHRDIKPQNIIITSGNVPILLDFGAARYMTSQKTRSLSVVLTPGFAPFEQYQTHGNQGAWTDIYSLCASIYFMLTGLIPLVAPERMAKDALVSLDKIAPNVSEPVRQAVMQGLAIKVEDRLKSVNQLREILESPDPRAEIETRETGKKEEPVRQTGTRSKILNKSFIINCISGDYQGSILQLAPDMQLSIGRDPKTVNLFISDPEISRVHTQVWPDEDKKGVWVADCKSLNGTYYFPAHSEEEVLDWLPIETKQLLKPGDQFRLGANENVFQVGEEWGDPENPQDDDKTGVLVGCPSCGLKNIIEQNQPIETAVCTDCGTPLVEVKAKDHDSSESKPPHPPPRQAQEPKQAPPSRDMQRPQKMQMQPLAPEKKSYAWVIFLAIAIIAAIIIIAVS